MALNLPFITKDTTRDKSTAKPIQDFISQVKSGAMARSNRFAILFTPPSGVDPSGLVKTLLFCDQVQLPGLNLSTVQNRTFGEFREVPYEKLFDNINMSFYVDNDLKVKALFDDWMNAIQDPVTRSFNYYDKYTTNMVIQVQDINDKTRYEVTLYECYPKNIGAVQMDQASKDVMKLNITLQYKYWTSSTVAPLANGQEVSTSLIDKFRRNYDVFQQELNKLVGDRAGNFITGSAITYGVTKLPGLLKF